MQMIKNTTRVSKLATRAPRSMVARAIEPPQAPATTTETPAPSTEGVIMMGECENRCSWPLDFLTTRSPDHPF